MPLDPVVQSGLISDGITAIKRGVVTDWVYTGPDKAGVVTGQTERDRNRDRFDVLGEEDLIDLVEPADIDWQEFMIHDANPERGTAVVSYDGTVQQLPSDSPLWSTDLASPTWHNIPNNKKADFDASGVSITRLRT